MNRDGVRNVYLFHTEFEITIFLLFQLFTSSSDVKWDNPNCTCMWSCVIEMACSLSKSKLWDTGPCVKCSRTNALDKSALTLSIGIQTLLFIATWRGHILPLNSSWILFTGKNHYETLAAYHVSKSIDVMSRLQENLHTTREVNMFAKTNKWNDESAQ